MLEPAPNPATLPAPASYHWTPALQAEFLGHLAATGSVKHAAQRVGMSPRAAHDLRHRGDGAAFRIGWAAAVLIARAALEDAMLDRALFGTEESWERTTDADAGTQHVTRRRHHVQTGLAMLARLDRMADVRAATLDARLAQLAAGDWASYLALFADPGFADELDGLLARWFADRVAAPDRLFAIVGLPSIASEVAQISKPSGLDGQRAAKPRPAPLLPERHHTVWLDEGGAWRTSFPPPPGFTGEECYEYGHEEYSRTLSDEELAKIEEKQAEIERGAELLRRKHFGFDYDDWEDED